MAEGVSTALRMVLIEDSSIDENGSLHDMEGDDSGGSEDDAPIEMPTLPEFKQMIKDKRGKIIKIGINLN